MAGGAMRPRSATLPVVPPDLTLTLGGLYARDAPGDRGESVERQRLHPLPREVPATGSRMRAGASMPPPCASLPASDLAAVALSEPAIAQELDRWIRHSHVAPAVAEQVLSALMACRGDPSGHLILSGVALPENDPLPDLSIVVPHATVIDLAHTGLVEVPLSLLRLHALVDLALNDNTIAWLPEEIGDMARLEVLELHHNELTELPAGICHSRLVALDVSNCLLVALPAAMGEMQSLRRLWLGGNPDLAALPDSLARLHADCEIHVNRAMPFRPHELRQLADEVFAGGTDTETSSGSSRGFHGDVSSGADTDTDVEIDSDSDHPAEAPSLIAEVAAWRQAPSSPRPGGQLAAWADFAAEDNAPGFAAWLHRLPDSAGGDSPEVASGVSELLLRMQNQPEFRRQCFALAADAMGACEDRVAMGFGHMQAALLASRAAAGELSPAQLMDASLRLFNRKALREFAVAHARQAQIAGEELELVLALEIRLRDRLALPQGAREMLNEDFVQSRCEVTDAVLDAALAHVHDRQRDPGAGGLKEFLAGQGRSEFTAWADHLLRKHPDAFTAAQTKAQALHEKVVESLGDAPEADVQAGIESKALYRQEFAEVVWRLTQASLPSAATAGGQAGGAQPDGAGSGVPADQVAAFHAAATAARARQRLQRGDERQSGSPPGSSPPRSPR